MKKLTLCVFALLLCVFTLTAGADEPFLKFEFSHNATDAIQSGDVIVCTLECSDINDKGLSSMEFVVEHSEGLVFNNDAKATGLDSAWALWRPNVADGKITFAVVDESAVVPGTNDFKVTFSFTVSSDKPSKESIELSEYVFYDFDLNEVESYTREVSDGAFLACMPEAILTNEGASLRINNTPALRFGVVCDLLPEGAEVGFVVSETDKLDGELTHLSPSAKELPASVNIRDGFLATEAFEISSNTQKYTFRPFVKINVERVGDYFIYFSPLERSASDVAQLELDNTTDPSTREILKGFMSDT